MPVYQAKSAEREGSVIGRRVLAWGLGWWHMPALLRGRAALYILAKRSRSPMGNDIDGRAPMRAAAADMLSRCNNAALRKAARRLGKLYDSVLAPSGLKATQCILVAQICDLGNPSMAELADCLLMDLSATRHSLDPLIRDRLVRVRVDAQDRRVKRVALTAAGLAKFKELMRLWQGAQDRFEDALGSERAATLRSELSFLASEQFKLRSDSVEI
jgi:DNA-binding MarR family transcriptional regulator